MGHSDMLTEVQQLKPAQPMTKKTFKLFLKLRTIIYTGFILNFWKGQWTVFGDKQRGPQWRGGGQLWGQRLWKLGEHTPCRSPWGPQAALRVVSRVFSRKKTHPAHHTHGKITSVYFCSLQLTVLLSFYLIPKKVRLLSFSLCKYMLVANCMDIFSHISQFTYEKFIESLCISFQWY